MRGKRNAMGNQGGRPEHYKPEYANQVYKICLLGLIDTQIAQFFDISVRTLNNWKKRYPDFRDGMWRGKTIADAEVAHALYRLACGFSYTETKVIMLKDAQGERVIQTFEVMKYMPPNVQACKFWLTNRRPQDWSYTPKYLPPSGQNVYVRRDPSSGEILIENQEAINQQWVDQLEGYLSEQVKEVSGNEQILIDSFSGTKP